MARTPISPQRITSDTLLEWEPANVDGNSIPNAAGYVLLVHNGGASEAILTVPTPETVDGLAIADRDVPVAAGTHRAINLRGKREYTQPDGSAHVNYSAVDPLLRVAVLAV